MLRGRGALVALAAACLFGFGRYEAFLTGENLLNVLRQNSMLGLIALGMTAVILTGGIDLSVGALLAAGGLAAAAASGHGTGAAVVAGIGIPALLGIANGMLVAKARIQPFIATLAMMIAARGTALGVTGEQSVSVAPAAAGLVWLGRGWLGPVPVPVLLLAGAYGVGWLVLRYTTFGRHIYAVGDDEDAARLLGLRTDRVLVGTYALSGALAGLAGVVLAGRLGAGQPVAGTGWVLLGVILNLLNLEGTLSPWWQWVIRGAFLLAVVMPQGRTRRTETYD
jgi:ribose/xylose/arabinose/galactoside ABC-type transport system permease subunit